MAKKATLPAVAFNLIDSTKPSLDYPIKMYRKDVLIQCMMPLRPLIFNQPYEVTAGRTVVKNIFEKYVSEGAAGLKKDELVALITSFMSHPANLAQLLRHNKPDIFQAYLYLINNIGAREETLGEMFGVQPTFVDDDCYYTSDLPTALWLPVASVIDRRTYWSKQRSHTLYITPEWRAPLAKAFIGPEALDEKVTDGLPDDSALIVEDFEAQMVKDFLYLSGLRASGQLLTPQGKFSGTKLKAAVRKLDGPAFHAVAAGEVQSRSELSVGAVMLMDEYNRSHRDPLPDRTVQDMARFAYDKLSGTLVGPIFGLLYPGWTGFTKTWTEYSRAPQIFGLVKKLIGGARDKWLDMANFRLRYLCADNLSSDGGACTGLFRPDQMSKCKAVKPGASAGHGWTVNIWSDLTWPYVIAMLRWMCAVGILELAVDPTAPADDPMHGIRYIRYTALGRYAAGWEKTYTPKVKVAGETAHFDLDSRNMIVTLLDKDSPYHVFLGQIGRRVAKDRYAVKPASMVRGCKDRGEVESRIDTFRGVIIAKPGPAWEALFAQAVERTKCGLGWAGDYMLVKVNPAVPGLIDLIKTNTEITAHCHQAQGNFLLVPTDFERRFTTILNNAGYIL